MDIKAGKSIAAVLEPLVAVQLKKQLPQLKILNIPLASNQQSIGHGIGIAKHNLELINQVSAAVAELKKDGTLPKLEELWFRGDVHDTY